MNSAKVMKLTITLFSEDTNILLQITSIKLANFSHC